MGASVRVLWPCRFPCTDCTLCIQLYACPLNVHSPVLAVAENAVSPPKSVESGWKEKAQNQSSCDEGKLANGMGPGTRANTLGGGQIGVRGPVRACVCV